MNCENCEFFNNYGSYGYITYGSCIINKQSKESIKTCKNFVLKGLYAADDVECILNEINKKNED